MTSTKLQRNSDWPPGALERDSDHPLAKWTKPSSERLAVNPLWRLFFATGFLGAYTTFSTYTYEAATLIRGGAYVPALLYVVGSVAFGLLGVLAGIAVAERL